MKRRSDLIDEAAHWHRKAQDAGDGTDEGNGG